MHCTTARGACAHFVENQARLFTGGDILLPKQDRWFRFRLWTLSQEVVKVAKGNERISMIFKRGI